MNLPKEGTVVITPTKPWGLLLANNTKKNLSQVNSLATYLQIGHDNELYQFKVTSNNKNNFTKGFPIRIKKTAKGYKLGPTVGIMTTTGKKGIKGNIKNFIDIIKMGNKTGLLIYVFSAESVNRAEKKVKAYLYLQQHKRWIAAFMPLPDVVYNRIPSRKDELKPLIQTTIQFLKSEDIPFFNPSYFNKWCLYQWMSESPGLNFLLPTTKKLTKQNLIELLPKNSSLYLKPVDGKAGNGFLKITNKNNIYILSYQNSRIVDNQAFTNYESLWKKISKYTNNTEYIIQTGIQLNTYQGSPFDIRVLVQKNGLGKWLVSGIGVRVAGEKSITTHVPRGGYIASVDQVFTEVYGKQISPVLKERITELAIEIAKHIEKKSGAELGEISLDLGIDQEGYAWFFEANSKPMEFDEPAIRQTSLLRLMQYFRYLSGFVPE